MKYSRLLLFLLVISLVGAGTLAAKPAKRTLDKNQVLYYNLTTEPKVLDPALSTGLPESRVEHACFEGLTNFGVNDRPIPAGARKWKTSSDGKTYTFYLRKNAKWSNGDPVTAYEIVEYIHANPVRRGLVTCPEDWPWSSAADWAGKETLVRKVDRTIPPISEWRS